MADFTIPSGDNITISGTVTGFSDITGYTITMSAKAVTTSNKIFTKTATIDNPTSGTFHFNLTPTDTSQTPDIYNYDFKVVDTSGNIQHTLSSSFLIVEPIT